MELSDRIKEFQRKTKYTAAAIAAEIGCTRPPVSAWIDGKSKPSLDNAVALARVMGCTLCELAGVPNEGVVLTEGKVMVLTAYRESGLTPRQAVQLIDRHAIAEPPAVEASRPIKDVAGDPPIRKQG